MIHQERLTQLECSINGHQRNFYEAGKALMEIRDSRLYKLIFFETFEAYTKARWDMGKSQAYRLINAYKVIRNLSPIGEILPVNEAQSRPLAELNDTEQRSIWRAFLKTKADITSRNIRQFITEKRSANTDNNCDLSDTISSGYKCAVNAMLTQVRIARQNGWQRTSRQAALLWNRVVRETILGDE